MVTTAAGSYDAMASLIAEYHRHFPNANGGFLASEVNQRGYSIEIAERILEQLGFHTLIDADKDHNQEWLIVTNHPIVYDDCDPSVYLTIPNQSARIMWRKASCVNCFGTGETFVDSVCPVCNGFGARG